MAEPTVTGPALTDAAVTEENEPTAAASAIVVESEPGTMITPAPAVTKSGESSATKAPTGNRAFWTTRAVDFATQTTDFSAHRQTRRTSPAHSRISQFFATVDDDELLLLATAKVSKERSIDRDRFVRDEADEKTASEDAAAQDLAPQDAATLDDPLACVLANWR